jgi:hypothetical protein
MVYTKHIPIHTMKHLGQSKEYIENALKTIVEKTEDHFDTVFPYIMNEDKTLSRQLVSGYGITDVYNAAHEFLLTKELASKKQGASFIYDEKNHTMTFDKKSIERGTGKGKAVLARHFIQSFSPEDNLTPEQVHEIGRQTMLEYTGGEYEFVIATHIDKNHLHNHIVVNSTNTISGKSMPWKISKLKNGKDFNVSKNEFEKISDKIASKYGAKIIEKSPKNSHKKYTKWQTESLYKHKIKSRVDYLLQHSHSIPDFLTKADALHLEVDFSGKWATYRLLDEPQIKNTRSRALSKTNPEKYNLAEIEKRLNQNEHVVSVEEVVTSYEEKVEGAKNDFDYQVIIEDWQLSHKTEKGYYVNVDLYGVKNRGQIFIGAYKVDELDDGTYSLYLKKDEYFYFMDQRNAADNKYMMGKTLARQLSLYNGTTPLKKEPIIRTMDEIVDAINFLASHGATTGAQVSLLEEKLNQSLAEADEKLSELDQKIIYLNEAMKQALVSSMNPPEEEQDYDYESEVSYEELKEELASVKLGRGLLKKKFDETVEELNKVHGIQFVAKKEQPDNQLKK